MRIRSGSKHIRRGTDPSVPVRIETGLSPSPQGWLEADLNLACTNTRQKNGELEGCPVPVGPGVPELIIVMAIVVMLFGVGKLPEVGKGLGKSIHDFRRAVKGAGETNDAE